jgi:hypothetical protein
MAHGSACAPPQTIACAASGGRYQQAVQRASGRFRRRSAVAQIGDDRSAFHLGQIACLGDELDGGTSDCVVAQPALVF